MNDMVEGLKDTAKDLAKKLQDKAVDIRNVMEQLKAFNDEFKEIESGLEGIIKAIKVYEPRYDASELTQQQGESPTVPELQFDDRQKDLIWKQKSQPMFSRQSKPLWQYVVDVLRAKDNQYSRASEVGEAIDALPDAPDLRINTASILAAVTRKEDVFEVKREQDNKQVSFRLRIGDTDNSGGGGIGKN